MSTLNLHQITNPAALVQKFVGHGVQYPSDNVALVQKFVGNGVTFPKLPGGDGLTPKQRYAKKLKDGTPLRYRSPNNGQSKDRKTYQKWWRENRRVSRIPATVAMP